MSKNKMTPKAAANILKGKAGQDPQAVQRIAEAVRKNKK